MFEKNLSRFLLAFLAVVIYASISILPAHAAVLDSATSDNITVSGAIVSSDFLKNTTPVELPKIHYDESIDYNQVKLLPSIPLAANIQKDIFIGVCKGNVEQFIMLMAVAKQESRSFNVLAIGDNGRAYGLFQIWPLWHWARMQRLGIYSAEELLDPVKCARVALDYLEWIKSSRGLTTMHHSVYVIYNAGHYTTDSVVASRANNVMNYYYEFMTEFATCNPDLT